jgi:oxalate/formate antiporter
MAAPRSASALDHSAAPASRWVQLFLGVACMVAASNVQYSWTLFVPEIVKAHEGWSRAALQATFSFFVIVQTWSTPVLGHFIDRHGPRPVVLFGGVMTALGWVVYSYVALLSGFYVGAVIAGLGVGAVYATAVNNALKLFPEKRGLAVGLTAGGYGSGTILTIIPIANMLKSSGYQSTFLTFGLVIGAVICACALFLRMPPAVTTAPKSVKVVQSSRDYTVAEALRTPVFWLLLLMFTGVVTGGLMVTAQLSFMAEDLGVGDTRVSLLFITMAALQFALMLDRIMNGLSRPIFGWISDNIGRERTMCLAFTIEGLGVLALGWLGSNPTAFVLLSGIVFLAWGEVYSLFSATAADTFGTRHLGKIYGALYCAKGIAAILVPFGNVLKETTGSWHAVLYSMAAMDLLAAAAALFLLRPLLRRHHAQNATSVAYGTAAAPARSVTVG